MLEFSNALNIGTILNQINKCATESLQHLFHIPFVPAEVILHFSIENLRRMNF